MLGQVLQEARRLSARRAGARANALPRLGAGVGWRPERGRGLLAALGRLDVLEVLADAALAQGAKGVEETRDLAELAPVVTHGVELSLASEDGPDRAYLRRLKRVVDAAKSPWHGEHAALTRIGQRRLGRLTPAPRTRRQLAVMARNARLAQDALGVPLAVENIAAPEDVGRPELSEPDFLSELARRAGCFLILDVENLALNAEARGFDPRAWLRALDGTRVVQMHLAGGVGGVDSHSRPVSARTWALYEAALPLCPNLRCVVIERDAGFGSRPDAVQEAGRARRLWLKP